MDDPSVGPTNLRASSEADENHLETMKGLIPLQRFAQPEEIASAVVWLASDGAGYVNGAFLPVDGGIEMGH